MYHKNDRSGMVINTEEEKKLNRGSKISGQHFEGVVKHNLQTNGDGKSLCQEPDSKVFKGIYF